MSPKNHDVFTYKFTLEFGKVESYKIVLLSLSKLFNKYKANQYDVLKLNCNHFSNEFLTLIVGRGLPKYLNRIAYVGSFLHCIVPKKYLIVTPNF